MSSEYHFRGNFDQLPSRSFFDVIPIDGLISESAVVELSKLYGLRIRAGVVAEAECSCVVFDVEVCKKPYAVDASTMHVAVKFSEKVKVGSCECGFVKIQTNDYPVLRVLVDSFERLRLLRLCRYGRRIPEYRGGKQCKAQELVS